MLKLANSCRQFISYSVLLIGLASLTMGGCPPTGGNEPPPGREVNVVISPSENAGSVTQDSDGETAVLTAIANAGWIFDGWSGINLEDPDAATITVDVSSAGTITANFLEDDSPGDSDGDGVRDGSDDCPNTPAGTTVDASGCPADPSELDSDNDGVNDADDECENTPTTVEVDENGCPVSAGGPDDDEDGVPNDIDQCENTNAGAEVDANGCAASQLDTDGDTVTDDADQCPGTPPRTVVLPNGCPESAPPPPPPPAGCGDGVVTGTEECDGPGETALCNSNCTLSRCSDGILNVRSGEQCDDGNITPGDGCGANCQNEISNERCNAPLAVGDGTRTFSNLGSTTDGPNEPAACTFFQRSNVEADIWYCYTATCTGPALVSLCGSNFDTKLAVYAGCDCPTAAPLACSDDDCGTGVENIQSRVTISVVAGEQYLVRAGSFLPPGEEPDAQGDGRLTIGCNVDACANGTGDCLSASTTPGCGDATCCSQTCELDRFCCDVTWDATCAAEAEGVCDGNFESCAATSGDCGTADTTPGCDNTTCCNTVCAVDPFCCLSTWDDACVDRANFMCFLTCGEAGACDAVHATPGCSDSTCCERVCANDGFCCESEWDDECVEAAAELCP